MSILETPRFNFTGIFYCNPCTQNNDDVLPDVVVRDTSSLGTSVDGHGDDDQIRAYLASAEQRSDYGKTDCKWFLNGGWNPYGNHWCNFMNAAVQSGVSEIPSTGPVPVTDGILGMPVKLLGSQSTGGIPPGDPVMVDMDCTGLVTTQIFVGGIQIGDPNDGGVIIQADATAFQSWLNFNATVSANGYGGEQNFVGIGCMMQFVLPGSAVPCPTPEMPQSLQNLLNLAQAGGLVVRFQIFEVEPGYTDQYLGEKFSKNQRLANIAYGYAVGTIGVWQGGEPVSEPDGRKLMAPYPRPEMYWTNQGVIPYQNVPGCPEPWQGPPALFGNVVALVRANGTISLDLASAFAKYGYRNPNGPQKESPPEGFDQPLVGADMGDLELCYVPAGSQQIVRIGTIAYGLGDQLAAFRANGCIQDMLYDGTLYDDISAGTLLIRGNPYTDRPNCNIVVLTERSDGLRVIVEPRTVYVGVPGASTQLSVLIRERGLPPAANTPTTLYVREYANTIKPGATTTCGPNNVSRPNQTTDARDPNDPNLQPCFAHEPVVTLYGAVGQIEAQAIAAGVSMLAITLDDVTIGESVPAWSTFDYSTMRVYTNDDYSAQIAAGLTWDFVYAEVLRFYYILYPAMTQYVKLNQRCAVYAARNAIRTMMCTPDQPEFQRTWNMPVTRQLSPGKIQLLMAWLAQEEADPTCPCKNQS